MQNMLPVDAQYAIEYTYNRKFIDRYIDQEIRENPEMEAKVAHGVQLLEDYRSTTYSYDSKNARMAQLQTLDLEELVRRIFVGVAYCQTPELFTSISAQLAGRLKFSDKEDGIKTLAEMLAVLCLTDAFDIVKAERASSLVIQAHIPLSQQLLRYIEQSCYLPPMVCAPRTVRTNSESGYLTHNDSLLLGKYNHHDGDLCLDVINTQNQIPLQLDTHFLSTVEETPTFALDTPEKLQQWSQFADQSQQIYRLIANHDQFYLTNKVDKRGRMYAQGYHITPQGTAYKKAMVEFAEQEVVNGVPEHCRLCPGT